MKSKIILFIVGYGAWLLLCWPPDAQHYIAGVIIAAFVSFMTGDLFTSRPHIFAHFQRYLWFLYYIPVFVWECFKANLDVAWRVIHPSLPIRPGIVEDWDVLPVFRLDRG